MLVSCPVTRGPLTGSEVDLDRPGSGSEQDPGTVGTTIVGVPVGVAEYCRWEETGDIFNTSSLLWAPQCYYCYCGGGHGAPTLRQYLFRLEDFPGVDSLPILKDTPNTPH